MEKLLMGFSKGSKIILKVAATVTLLLLLFCLLLRFPVVQSWAAKRAANYLSLKLNTHVEVGSVNIEFIKKIVLNDVFIEDRKNDTLLFAGEIKSDIGFHKLFGKNQKLVVTEVELNNARVKLHRYKEDDGLSLQFIIDYFASGKKDTAASAFDFSVEKIKLNNVHFSLRDLRYNDSTTVTDFTDLDVRNIYGYFSEIKFNGDTVSFNGNHLSFEEKKGFVVNNISAKTKLAPGMMQYQNLKIQTPQTDISTQLTFTYDSLPAFDHFYTLVHINSDFSKSTVASKDIAFFTSDVKNFNQKILLEGKIKGTLAAIKAKNLHLQFGKYSEFKGDVSLNGLPNLQETFMNLKIEKLTLNKTDVETIKTSPFEKNEFVQLPDNISALGNVTYKGVFTGFYNDFVAYGNINSAIGFLSTDINLKFNQDMQKSSYSGKIIADNFNFGKFFNQSEIGAASFDVRVAGSGFSSEKIKASLDGKLSSAIFKNYHYQNISLDGKIARKLFNGAFSINEQDLKLDFNGTVDLNGKLPVFNFTTNIERARLAKLNLINRDSTSILSAKVSLNMTGLKIDDLDGNIKIESVHYQEINKEINADNIDYYSGRNGSVREIKLNSDFADVNMQGDFKLVNVPTLLLAMLSKYMPPVVLMEKNCTNENQHFTFNATIKKTDEVFDLFVPGLRISNPSTINGSVDGAKNNLRADAGLTFADYKNFHFKDVNINCNTSGNNFNLFVDSKKLEIGDSLKLLNINVSALSQKEKANVELKILNADSSHSKIDLKTTENFLSSNKVLVKILPSLLMFENREWNVDASNQIFFDSSGVSFSNLIFSHDEQSLKLDGKISEIKNDELSLVLKKFNVGMLNPLLQLSDVNLGGIANGTIHLLNLKKKPAVDAAMQIENFSYWRDTLGEVNTTVNYNDDESKITVNAFVQKNEKKEITINGDYLIKPKNDELDFAIKVEKANATPFGRYLNSFASEVKGLISGDLHLYGLASKPYLTGAAKLQKASMKIDYLNTKYFFAPDEIKLEEKLIRFTNVMVNDEKGNSANLNGTIYHDHLKKFTYNFSLDALRFFCLNTSEKQNNLFYGTGYASGRADIFATEKLLKFNLALKTEKGTQIFIPLSNPEEVGEKEFISFVNHDSVKAKVFEKQTDLSGIDLDFKLEATPDAEVQLIFDSKIGDVMKGKGSGNLSMQIDPLGEFSMFGDYTVESGDYLFTLKNVVNKKFIIQNGGTISWSGSPYDATLDINAKYNLKASTYDLIPDSANRRRVPIELGLHLTGNLMNPDVNFSIEAPQVAPSMQTQIKSALSSEQKLNRQVFGLLVLNRFLPQDNANTNNESSTNAVGKSLGELASTQLTNWLSQVSSTVDIGVNYRPGDALNRRDEFEVSLSTDISDRISVGGNFGVGNSNSQNTSNVIGDFNVEFKATKEGKLRFRAFNKTNQNNLLNNSNSQYTQGIGLFYREEFNTWSELIDRFRNRKKKNKDTPSLSKNL